MHIIFVCAELGLKSHNFLRGIHPTLLQLLPSSAMRMFSYILPTTASFLEILVKLGISANFPSVRLMDFSESVPRLSLLPDWWKTDQEDKWRGSETCVISH